MVTSGGRKKEICEIGKRGEHYEVRDLWQGNDYTCVADFEGALSFTFICTLY